MALQIRRGASADRVGIVPAVGELIYTIDTKEVFIGDGVTSGGNPVGKTITFAAGSGAYNNSTGVITIPTNTNHLTNGAGFITSSALNGYATETFVNSAVSNLVASAPAALNTLNELATALGNDANFATTITTALGNKVDVSDLTGTTISWSSMDGGNVTSDGTYISISQVSSSSTGSALALYTAVTTGALVSGTTVSLVEFGANTIAFTLTSGFTFDQNAGGGGGAWVASATVTSGTATSTMGASATFTSGGLSYNSLTNKPTLFSGSYADLTNKPTIFSGNYDDLTNKPTVPTNTNQLTNGSGFITASALSGYATETFVNTAVSNLVASAPAALNTLNELATALGNDANYSTTISTALGNRLRVDVNTQGLTTTQKSNAVTNLGLATVATSGSYNDLSNKPTQYTDALARAAHSFTAGSGAYNSSTGVITIPTNTNQLTNGAGYLTASALTGKQDTLVSGTSIKTINGTSLLGSGDITISGGGGGGGSTGDVTFTGSSVSAAVTSPQYTSSNWSLVQWQGSMAIRVDTNDTAMRNYIAALGPGSKVIIGTSTSVIYYTVSTLQWYGNYGYIYFTTQGETWKTITSLVFVKDKIVLSGSLEINGYLFGPGQTTPTKLFGDSLAIGGGAGTVNQASMAVALGPSAGQNEQQTWAVAIGYNAGNYNQGAGSIAIGVSAGSSNQGNYSIAIGNGTNGVSNSVVINGGSNTLTGTQEGLYVNPIRSDGTPTKILYYNTATKEITYGDVPVSSGSGPTTFTAALMDVYYYNMGPIYVDLDFSSPSQVSEFLTNIGTNSVTVTGLSGPGAPSSLTIAQAEGSWTQSGSTKVRLMYPLFTPSIMSDYHYSQGTATFTYTAAGGAGGAEGYFISSGGPNAANITGSSTTVPGPANAGRILIANPYIPGQGGQNPVQNITTTASPFNQLMSSSAGSPSSYGTSYPWMSMQNVPANSTIQVQFNTYINGFPMYLAGWVLDSSSDSSQTVIYGSSNGYAPSGTLQFSNYIMSNNYYWSNPGWLYGTAYPQGNGDFANFTPAPGVTAYWDPDTLTLFFRCPASSWNTGSQINIGSVSGFSGSFGVSGYYFGN